VKSRVALVPFVVAALLAAGCGGDDGGSSAAALVDESADATAAVETFHFTLDTRGLPRSATGLQLTAAEGDVATPDSAKADVTGTFAGTPVTTQMVAIGDDTWIKNPLSGAWQAIDVSTTPLALLDPVEGVLGAMKGIADPVLEGTEEVGGVETQKIGGTVPAANVAPLVAVKGGDGDVPVTLWIGSEDKLLRRVEIVGAVADGEPAEAQRTIEISRFDEPVTIEPPEGTG